MVLYFGSFILLLAPLIFIHELGHYLFAKLFGVRVDVFSMGFGPKIFRKKVGETEYALSVVPLGGYVKLLGQDPNEKIEPALLQRTLGAQLPWKRFLIYIGGPLFNFLMAIAVYCVLLVVGEPHAKSILERIPEKTAAYVAGFRTGDVVTAIGSQQIDKADDIARVVSESMNRELVFRVKRAGAIREIKTVAAPMPGFSPYGESIDVGTIDGLLSPARHPVVGISDSKSEAAKAGFTTGTEILEIGGVRVKSWEQLENEASKQITAGSKEFDIGYAPHESGYWSADRRPQAAKSATAHIKFAAKPLSQLGLRSSELFVLSTVKGSPAETLGLAMGDRLVSIDGAELVSFNHLRELVQKTGEEKGKFTLVTERAGKLSKLDVVPNSMVAKDGKGREQKQYLIGVFPLFVQAESEMFVETIRNPFLLAIEAWTRTLDLSVKTIVSLKKLATREVSMGSLGGPLLIGKLAGDSMERGFSHFLHMMAVISISLAIFNILPVPVLDGGHITLLFIEVLRGRPFSIRQSELVQQVGLTLILLLLVVVMFNDISRIGVPALKQLIQ